MLNSQIKTVFDDMCSSIPFDMALMRKVCELESRFVSKKQEHIEFFGGNLTGVQVVRFTQADRDRLFIDVLDCDDAELEERIYALKDPTDPHQKKPLINPEWNVVSDVFNMACVWLIHSFHHSKHLDASHREEAKVRVCQYLMYKYLTSLLFRYFKYPADPEVARATYEQLSLKFRLKELGSWGATIREMAENLVSSRSPHSLTIENMPDQGVINMVGDIQGRVRDVLKNIYAVFDKVNKQGIRIASSSAFMVESDGESVLKDSTKSPGIYTRYIKSIISDKNSFIKQELVDVIAKIMHTMSPRLLMQTLNYTSDNYQHLKDGKIDEAIDIVMEHAIEYMQVNRTALRLDLPSMIDKLRGAYMSSRSTDISLMKARDLVEGIVRDATNSKNDSGIAAVRTAWMLYLVARAYAMRHYASR